MKDQIDDIDEASADRGLARRSLVAGAVAAVAAVAIDQARPASAADPNDVTMGVVNNATAGTTLTLGAAAETALRVNSLANGNGTAVEANGSAYGVYATGGLQGVHGDVTAEGAAGVSGLSRAASGEAYGVSGSTVSPDGFGVHGSAGGAFGGPGVGVLGNAGYYRTNQPPGPIGVYGTAEVAAGIGGVFFGSHAAVRLMPADVPGAPTTGAHEVGELVVGSDGRLHLCTAAGAPGTWVELQPRRPSLQLLSTPDRFIDTRSALGGVQGPVAAQSTTTYSITGRTGESGNAALQIPSAASAITGNLTVIGSSGVSLGSFVTLWPSGPRPTVSTINFGPSNVTGAVANGFTVGLVDIGGGQRGLSVFNNAACDYLLDVTGYYV